VLELELLLELLELLELDELVVLLEVDELLELDEELVLVEDVLSPSQPAAKVRALASVTVINWLSFLLLCIRM
jgi:hypothetical protein